MFRVRDIRDLDVVDEVFAVSFPTTSPLRAHGLSWPICQWAPFVQIERLLDQRRGNILNELGRPEFSNATRTTRTTRRLTPLSTQTVAFSH